MRERVFGQMSTSVSEKPAASIFKAGDQDGNFLRTDRTSTITPNYTETRLKRAYVLFRIWGSGSSGDEDKVFLDMIPRRLVTN
jgi:hypothetical protein